MRARATYSEQGEETVKEAVVEIGVAWKTKCGCVSTFAQPWGRVFLTKLILPLPPGEVVKCTLYSKRPCDLPNLYPCSSWSWDTSSRCLT